MTSVARATTKTVFLTLALIIALVVPLLVVGSSAEASAGPAPVSSLLSSTPHSSGATSTNWSGYAATGGSFTDVAATWTQPKISCRVANAYSSFWVGLDGDGTSTIEQTGTQAGCNGKKPTYYAWYEVSPTASVNVPGKVKPGDEMSASVSVSGMTFTMVITDGTRHWSHTIEKTNTTATGGSAEVITEAPGGGGLPLADFKTVTYSAATIDGLSLAAAGATPITMEQGGVIRSATSALSDDGVSFSTTWQHS